MGKDDIDPLTEEEKASWPKEPLVAFEKPFVDTRGAIQPLVDEMMKSAVMIESKKGSLRANHYHKTDWHYCYVMMGKIEYYHRPTGSDTPPEKVMVEAGQIIGVVSVASEQPGYFNKVDQKLLTLLAAEASRVVGRIWHVHQLRSKAEQLQAQTITCRKRSREKKSLTNQLMHASA